MSPTRRSPLPDPAIHPTAIVHPGARIGKGVVLGPFSVIGEHVELGDGTTVGPHAVLEGWTTIGREAHVGVGAVIGAAPQDLKYTGQKSHVRIGDRTTIREYVTIHRASDAGGATVIGSNVFLMGFVHVAHNCVIGDHVIITNSVGLSGHVTIEEHAIVGGMSGFHQHVRVGAYSIVGGNCGVRMDVVPFAMGSGEPFRIYGLNRVGLRRHGFSNEQRANLKAAFRVLFWSGLGVADAVQRLKTEFAADERVQRLVAFAEGSRRGLTPGVQVGAGEHADHAEEVE